ncbi:ABC transporter substrate-binding protein [Pararhodobacter zhoushanensis]|uniref:ABC transporter substrate-binding protein n=1 Tax=Pararhodobacter zhoushanensis TaxID=2479545 RepID=A0ABT3GZV7_9RHOB|nr:ABC transporter substrate-binding protein [Pararhodobacter zhoushanensis]MCW1933067.1 ABC transporter substrate-binding protein [Pararhodobacter zhoushanensis]
MHKVIFDTSLRPTRRSILMGAAAAAGAGMMLPGGAFAQEATPQRGGTLRVSMPYNPASLDPITGRNLPDFNTLYALYDALIGFDDETLELQPMLAKSWDWADPSTLVLELQDGVMFHDDTPFNAEAVVFNLRRGLDYARSNVKSDLAGVQAIEATGPLQVTIRLEAPNAALPAILSNRAGCMVSPASVQAAEDGNIDRAPVGAGPFRFIEWRDNDLIRLERNESYWQGPELPYLDALELRIINELNTAARTVTSGQADVALQLAAQQIMVARRSDNIIATATTSMTYYTAFFNYARGPLADLKVRQAMNYALNRADLQQVLLMGLGEATCSVFPREFWASGPDAADYYPYDPERARALLAEAGYPDGVDIATLSWPDQAAMQRTEIIGNQLAQVGIRLNVTPVQPAQAIQVFMIEEQGDMLLSPTGGNPDPSLAFDRQFSATALRNAGKIELDGYRELLEATMSTYDFDERQQKLFELEMFVVENALHLPQYMSAGMSIQTPQVKDFTFGILAAPRFHTVWLDQA